MTFNQHIAQTAVMVAIGLALLTGCSQESVDTPGPLPTSQQTEATFVGSTACAACHQEEHGKWMGSYHQAAQQPATPATVLGDFNDTVFIHNGITSRFFKVDDRFMISTEDGEGQTDDFHIKYVIGIAPLQQYVTEMSNGYHQVFQLCWDTRPKGEGGQRWFHLYPDENIPPHDILHWTGPNFNWNYMCADCHATDLKRNFDNKTKTFATSWSEFSVGCEACHGPASDHIKWAAGMPDPAGFPSEADKGLRISLRESKPAAWLINPTNGIPSRSHPLDSNIQVETCAPCHARRSPIADYVHAGLPLAETHKVSLMREDLYHADGQILDEVYVYGSFTQSKMFHKGVRCTDCHDPHSQKTHSPGNALCTQCHLPTKYDTPDHHHHPAGSTGASCVECHMPEKHYMVVDPRRDHSIRIPRPDLSDKLGTPNACTACHADKDNAWASGFFKEWYGEDHPRHYGEVFHAVRENKPGADLSLVQLASNKELPAIVRASATRLLGGFPSPESANSIYRMLRDTDPIIREAAVTASESLPPQARVNALTPLLKDPIKLVRIEAARVMSAVDKRLIPIDSMGAFTKGLDEYKESLDVIRSAAGSHMAYGLLYSNLGEQTRALDAYKEAIALDPNQYQVHVNLADMYYRMGQTEKGKPHLDAAVKIAPESGPVHQALGFYHVRTKDYETATHSLIKAAGLMPSDARLQFFCGVALNQIGNFDEALPYLKKAYALERFNVEYLSGLTTICIDNGEKDLALRYARQLQKIDPLNPGYKQLIQRIQAMP